MSFVHWLVILSVLITLAGAAGYIRDTLKGETKPNRVTWTMWALAPLIGTVAALSARADIWVTSRTFLAGFIPLLVLAVSFANPKSYWKLTIFDLLCGLLSLCALAAWAITKSPQIAVLFALVGDFFAAIPTIHKAWLYPETETGYLYFSSFIGVLLVFPSIPKFDIQNSAFQIYLLVVDVILIFAVYRKRLGIKQNFVK